MIRRYNNNRITRDSVWSYETLEYETAVVEDILYKVVLYKKKHGKSTSIGIRGANDTIVAFVMVKDSDLYTINGRGHIGCLFLCDYTYKIRFSSWDTITIATVK